MEIEESYPKLKVDEETQRRFEEVYKNRFVSLYERLNKYYFEQKRLRILIKILWFIYSDNRTLNDKNLDHNIIEPHPLDALKSKILFP